MPDDRSRLIETAVRSFSDNQEMKAAAIHSFGELVMSDPECAQEAINRWDAVDAKAQKPRWRWVLFSVLFVSLASLLIVGVPRFMEIKATAAALRSIGRADEVQAVANSQVGRKNLSQSERLILYGDESQSSKVGRAKGVWDRYPENPAYYAQYLEAYYSEKKELPEDFLSTARQIDPQNSWFTYLAAGVEARKAVSKKKRSETEKAAKGPQEWDVLDQERMDASLKLIREAGNQSFLNDYQGELMRQQIALLAQDSALERWKSVGYLSVKTASNAIVMMSLGDVIAVKASQLAKANDTQGFRELMIDADHLTRHTMHSEPSTLIAGLVYSSNLSAMAKNLAASAKELGFQPEAEKYQAIHDQIRQRRESRKNADLLIDGLELNKKSDRISALTIPMVHRQVVHPPIITDADLKPGRLKEHEWVAILFSLGMIVILGFIILQIWAFQYGHKNFSVRFAKRLDSLLTAGDWVAIIGIGVVLPFFLVIGLNRFTPLGGRDFSISGMNYVLPASHYIDLLLLMLILPVLMARFRLGKRIAGFASGWGNSWLGWISVFLIIVRVALIGPAMKSDSDGLKVMVASLVILPVIWLLATVVHSVVSARIRVLMSGAIARILVPTYATAMLLMALLLPVLIAAEAHWFRDDTFSKLDPMFPGLSSFEYKVTVQLQRETREILGYQQ